MSSYRQAVRSRTQAGDSTARAIIIDDLKAQRLVVKHFSLGLAKLLDGGQLREESGMKVMNK
jgi:hypothetical protein